MCEGSLHARVSWTEAREDLVTHSVTRPSRRCRPESIGARRSDTGTLRGVTWPTTLALGAVVGLGVAMPLGAIGVLLLQTGMSSGWRTAAAGGLGAATVDLLYATLAVLAGTAVSGALVGHEKPVRLVGAAVLAGVAVVGVAGAWRGRRTLATDVPDDAAVGPGSPARAYLRFVVLTAVNPLTVVYFTAVAAGLGERLGGWPDRSAFVVGIGVASAAWQLALAGGGALLGARVPAAVRTAMVLAGYGIVAAFAIALALR